MLTQGLQEIPLDLGSICQSSLHMDRILGPRKVVWNNRSEYTGSLVEQGFFLVEQCDHVQSEPQRIGFLQKRLVFLAEESERDLG